MKINEIFNSIQGETSFAGLPFTFVRLTGCNLRCSYCDTPYAYEEGVEWSIDQVLAEIHQKGIARIVLTGGEPLLQNETPTLCSLMAEKGFSVLLETNGSMPIKNIDQRVHRILDLKCPGSGMDAHMDFKNINYLTPRDEVKFVVSDRNDFQWALTIIKRYNLEDRTHILISPAHQLVHPRELAEWIMQEKLNARLQLQLQKYVWPDKMRGV
jgi:7-carboxy-7-deazaguanine synthase